MTRLLTSAITLVLVLAATTAPATFVDRPLEGFGADTPGGAGGEAYVVTSLGDDGPGTLRDAISSPNRYITFAVGGTIAVESGLRISSDCITVDAVDAPDPGITITAAHSGVTGALLDIRGAGDVIVRNIAVRDAPDTNAGDNMRVSYGAHDVVIDHCSFSGAGDGNLDICIDVHDVTVQWCLIADTVKNSLIRTDSYNISLHHNLFAYGEERNPQLDDVTFVDMVNNVISCWGSNYGTRIRNGASANIVKNYYVADDGSDASDAIVLEGSAGPVFLDGNVLPPACSVSGTSGALLDAPPVTEMEPEDALAAVLAEAGAFPRSSVDDEFVTGVEVSPVEQRSWGEIKAMFR